MLRLKLKNRFLKMGILASTFVMGLTGLAGFSQTQKVSADVYNSDYSTTVTTNSYQIPFSSAEQAAQNFIAQRESSDNYYAQNGQYYGKYQLGLSLLNGDLSPENQERTANNYVMNRYGSWVNAEQFWLQNGWY